MIRKKYNYLNPNADNCNWYKGLNYDVGICNNMLYGNNSGSWGKVTVFIFDKEKDKTVQRTGISYMCGNFGYIDVNFKGEKIDCETLLKR